MIDQSSNPPLAGKTKDSDPYGYDVSAAEVDVLAAVDGAIDKLNRLGIAIRQSSTRNLAARTPAEMSKYNDFKEKAHSMVKSLYPDASDGLQDLLGRSIAERYQSIVSHQARQTQLQQRRPGPVPDALPAITEEEELDANVWVPPAPERGLGVAKHQYRQMAEIMDRLASGVSRKAMPWSDVSSVDSQLVYRHISGTPSRAGSKKRETSSIQINMVGYPKAPQPMNSSNFITCEWCSETHQRSIFEGDEWRYVHEPLVALAKNFN